MPVSRGPEAHLDAVAGIHNFGRMRDTSNRSLIFHQLTAAPVPAAPSVALYLLTPLLTHSPAVQLPPQKSRNQSPHHRISPTCPVGLQLHGHQYTAGRLRDALSMSGRATEPTPTCLDRPLPAGYIDQTPRMDSGRPGWIRALLQAKFRATETQMYLQCRRLLPADC